MKKYFKIAAAVCLSLVVATSCSKGSGSDSSDSASAGKETQKEGVIKPESTKINGDLSECYTIVDREYKFAGEYPTLLSVDLERTATPLPFDVNEYEVVSYIPSIQDHKMGAVNFTIEMLDADGNVIAKETAYDTDDCKTIGKLKAGEKGSIGFYAPLSDEQKKVVKFRITSEYETTEGEDGKIVSVSTPSVSDPYDDISSEYERLQKEAKDQYEKAYNDAKESYNQAVRNAEAAMSGYGY